MLTTDANLENSTKVELEKKMMLTKPKLIRVQNKDFENDDQFEAFLGICEGAKLVSFEHCNLNIQANNYMNILNRKKTDKIREVKYIESFMSGQPMKGMVFPVTYPPQSNEISKTPNKTSSKKTNPKKPYTSMYKVISDFKFDKTQKHTNLRVSQNSTNLKSTSVGMETSLLTPKISKAKISKITFKLSVPRNNFGVSASIGIRNGKVGLINNNMIGWAPHDIAYHAS